MWQGAESLWEGLVGHPGPRAQRESLERAWAAEGDGVGGELGCYFQGLDMTQVPAEHLQCLFLCPPLSLMPPCCDDSPVPVRQMRTMRLQGKELG